MTVDAVPPFEREGKILSRSYFVGVGVHSASRTTRTVSRGFEVWARISGGTPEVGFEKHRTVLAVDQHELGRRADCRP